MNIKRCNRCVMDNGSDSKIQFDDNGNCNYCNQALSEINTTYFPRESGKAKLNEMLEEIKEEGKNKPYDCAMGISGGLDSCYLAYLGYKWGLRILAFHVDDGFDTEVSKENINRLVKRTNITMVTIRPNEEQYNALIKAYMKAGVPNLAVPQDNILFACLYEEIRKNKIKYFLSGGNFALECILQQGNTHSAMDTVNIKAIHRKFGTKPIDKLCFISSYRKYFDMKVTGLQTLRPLNYIEYNRNRAFSELKEFCGFEYYGSKHLENKLTAFVQLYWLPKKFGVDKRTSHLSSMIVSGQMTREEALKELERPVYDKELMFKYIQTIKERLNISDNEFEELMNAPIHQHNEYKVDKWSALLRKIIK